LASEAIVTKQWNGIALLAEFLAWGVFVRVLSNIHRQLSNLAARNKESKN